MTGPGPAPLDPRGGAAESARWLADYQRTAAEATARAEETSAHLAEVSGWASSPRGEVEVTVASSGALEDLRLTPAARALEAEELARLIVTTTRQAQRAASGRIEQIMADYLGEGPGLDLVRQHFPAAVREAAENGHGPRRDDDYLTNPPEIFS